MRFILSLEGERDLRHRNGHRISSPGVEKIGERQSWHQFIPYTDRVDYFGGVANNLSYLNSVETLAGIKVPERAQFIRVMLTELFRINNHLVWFGTFLHDLGAIGPFIPSVNGKSSWISWSSSPAAAFIRPGFASGGWPRTCPKAGRRRWMSFVKTFPGTHQRV